MKLEDDQGFFQTVAKENDKTMSYLFVCVILLFFFSAFMLGLNRTQSVPGQTTSDSSQTVPDVMPEIGGSNGPSKR